MTTHRAKRKTAPSLGAQLVAATGKGVAGMLFGLMILALLCAAVLSQALFFAAGWVGWLLVVLAVWFFFRARTWLRSSARRAA